MDIKDQVKSLLLYGGISRADYQRVKPLVAESNHKALLHWTVLVSVFWTYCLLMSTRAADYGVCRPAYTGALAVCIFCYLCTRIVVKRFPKLLSPLMWLFRLSLLGGGIGIAICQWNLRSLTMFAVAIVAPSIFIDNTVTSLAIHLVALILYIILGRNVIAPEIYSWGLGNFILFTAFGVLIGNAINKERFERCVFADSAKRLADMRARDAYYDPMTGLKNRRAYSERLEALSGHTPENCCVIVIDVNGLKRTNDTCGHAAGDELIIGTSECLRAAFPGSNDIYRLGGDEFCAIVTEDEACAQRCLTTLESIAAKRKGRCVDGISLACGMASCHDCGGIEETVREADNRMYEAKRRHYAEHGNPSRRYA